MRSMYTYILLWHIHTIFLLARPSGYSTHWLRPAGAHRRLRNLAKKTIMASEEDLSLRTDRPNDNPCMCVCIYIYIYIYTYIYIYIYIYINIT